MFVKFFVGVLQEVQHVGVVLVHDRPGFIKILVCIVIMAISVVILLIITGEKNCGTSQQLGQAKLMHCFSSATFTV